MRVIAKAKKIKVSYYTIDLDGCPILSENRHHLYIFNNTYLNFLNDKLLNSQKFILRVYFSNFHLDILELQQASRFYAVPLDY